MHNVRADATLGASCLPANWLFFKCESDAAAGQRQRSTTSSALVAMARRRVRATECCEPINDYKLCNPAKKKAGDAIVVSAK